MRKSGGEVVVRLWRWSERRALRRWIIGVTIVESRGSREENWQGGGKCERQDVK